MSPLFDAEWTSSNSRLRRRQSISVLLNRVVQMIAFELEFIPVLIASLQDGQIILVALQQCNYRIVISDLFEHGGICAAYLLQRGDIALALLTDDRRVQLPRLRYQGRARVWIDPR